jgi:hypothetical protein
LQNRSLLQNPRQLFSSPAPLAIASSLVSVMLSEDFEDGQAQGWNLSHQLADHHRQHDRFASGRPLDRAAYASTGSTDWQDYRLALQARLVNRQSVLPYKLANSHALRLEDLSSVDRAQLAGIDSANLNIGTTWHDYAIDAVGLNHSHCGQRLGQPTPTTAASLAGASASRPMPTMGAHFDNIGCQPAA